MKSTKITQLPIPHKIFIDLGIDELDMEAIMKTVIDYLAETYSFTGMIKSKFRLSNIPSDSIFLIESSIRYDRRRVGVFNEAELVYTPIKQMLAAIIKTHKSN